MRQNKVFPPLPSRPQSQPDAPPPRQVSPRQRLSKLLNRFRNVLLIVISVSVTLALVYVYDLSKPPVQHLTQRDIDAAVERALETIPPKPSAASQAYEVIRPSVVAVQTLIKQADGTTGGSLGTGVIVDQDGVIITSLHIINDAEEIRIIFADGSESEATVLVTQPENDLAVLQALIIPDDLVPAVLASSAGLQVGDEVIAVGNPFGVLNSVSAGVVSGLGRDFQLPESAVTLRNLIQFDAAVNPGNSGGPLVNRDGEVVGIVTGLLNPTDQEFFIGIGFAVTIETAGAAAGAPPV